MSGPKVVRIVTREEVLAICQGQLARVDAALVEWKRVGRRNECIDDVAIAEAQSRRDSLAALIEADRFVELQKEAPREEAFLRDDIQARLAAAAALVAARNSRARREKEAGTSLIAALDRDGIGLTAEVRQGLAAGKADALTAGFAALSRSATIVRADRERADVLGKGVERKDFETWLEAEGLGEQDPELEKLEARIVEIELGFPDVDTADLRQRLAEAVEVEGVRRSLLLDALGSEIRRLNEYERSRMQRMHELVGLLAEAEAAGLSTTVWREDLENLDATATTIRADAIRAALAKERAAHAALDRREAVLAGLASLGYEVREEMSAIWAERGELVIANPSRPGYGIEVRGGGEPPQERVQMRAVAFEGEGHISDRMRDRDAEALWCGDIASLRDRLRDDGDSLAIERALEIGAVALKRISISATSHGTTAGTRAPAARSLPRSQ